MTRTIKAKFAGKCARCCGPIPRGETCEYDPKARTVAHIPGRNGDGALRCVPQQDPGFVDLDRMYEDQCSQICGR